MRFAKIKVLYLGLAVFGALSLGAPIFGQNAQAQAFDPRLLEEIQRQAEDRRAPSSRRSAVDESRETARDNRLQSAPLVEGGPRLFVPDEEELENLSVLEEDFRARLEDEDLLQFGYDIFERYDAQETPLTGRIADDYVLGVGDEIIAIFQGSEEAQNISKVDSEGRLLIGKLPPVNAAGRRFGDLRAEIEERTKQTLLGTQVFLSVGAVKLINVQVIGEVLYPGSYVLDGLSDSLDALVAAGGVKKSGSLRNIRVLRGSTSEIIDLYGLLTGSGQINLGLRAGDRIVVPPLNNAVAVAGDVLRPGIYELSGGKNESLRDVLKFSGGAIRPRGFDITLNRISADGREEFMAVQDAKQEAKGADALYVSVRGGLQKGRVTLAGHVGTPGPRALGKVPTLSHVIEGYSNLLPDSFLPFAVLERRDARTRTKVLEAVNLLKVDAGADVQLRSEDRLMVFSKEDVDFLSSNYIRDIILGQGNPLPHCKSLEKLVDLAQHVQTGRFSGVVRGVFLVEDDGRTAAADLGQLRADGAVNVGQEAQVVDGAQAQQQTQIQANAAFGAGLGEEVFECPEVFEEDPDILPFALEHLVAISGAVRNPRALPIAGDMMLDSMITLAGGYANDAAARIAEVVSVSYDQANAATISDRRTIEGMETSFDQISIRPGSSIRVQTVADQQEIGAILLTGEFVRPGSYTIQRGETLAELIERAGGVTQQAYPYGAVFTRKSVKEAQKEGFKRAARELNAALAIAALKKNVDASAVTAAQQLSSRVSTAEALGRMVIEADPRVLGIRDDLDVVLEPGDTLFMPKRPGHVLMIGDVLNPGALQFIRGKAVSDYLAESGGLQSSADDDRIFLVYPNGVAKPVRVSAWRSSSVKVPPGSTIVVPKDTDPLAALDLTRDITSIVSQLAISAASLAVIFDRN